MASSFSTLPHRAVRRHRLAWHILLRDIVLTLAITWLLWWAMPDIAQFWAEQLNFWMVKTGLVGHAQVTTVHDFVLIPGFVITAPTLLPTAGIWWSTAALCAAIWILSLWLPRERLPLIYVLRLIALVQLSSLVFFYVWPDSLPTLVANFLTDEHRQAVGFMLLIPTLFALTLYLFALPWWAKYGATLTALLFMLLFVPLQAACHAWILQMGSILYMPTLYLFFGLLPQIVGLMGIYSFALSCTPSDEALAQRGLLDV
jgi:hypothetical protein